MARFQCPNCGEIFFSGGREWERSRVGRFESTAPGAVFSMGDVEEYSSSRPVGAPDVHGHFVTPFFQAMATGLAFFVLAGVVSIVWSLSFWLPFLVGPGAFALSWLWLLGRFNALLVAREFVRPRVERPDVEAKPAPRLVIDVSERSAEHSHTQIAELPLDVERLGVLARAVAGGQELTYSRWTGRGKLLSRGELGELQLWLVRCGLAAWVDPDRHSAGLEFSAGGRRFWSRVAAGEYELREG